MKKWWNDLRRRLLRQLNAGDTLTADTSPLSPVPDKVLPEYEPTVLDFERADAEAGNAKSEGGIGSGMSVKRPFSGFQLPTPPAGADYVGQRPISNLNEASEGHFSEHPESRTLHDAIRWYGRRKVREEIRNVHRRLITEKPEGDLSRQLRRLFPGRDLW